MLSVPFIDKQDTIYAHRADELFRNRKTVAIKEITPQPAKRQQPLPVKAN